jgi:hypothetical protein
MDEYAPKKLGNACLEPIRYLKTTERYHAPKRQFNKETLFIGDCGFVILLQALRLGFLPWF